MAILTHTERKIVCDLCFDCLSDYSTKTIREIRKENNIIRIKGKDYCESCNPHKL